VVAVMYSGGQALEAFAQGRAQREMTALLERQPREALLWKAGGLVEVSIEAIQPGDLVFVRKGDIVPADGVVASGHATVDLSSLTGETLPAHLPEGGSISSGAINVADPFRVRVEKSAAESTYASIVRLVEEARAAKAPMSRMADRLSLWFLVITVGMAASAYIFSGDPVRVLAVLVAATPCPLILAVPVALVSGLSRAASEKVLIKGGQVLEAPTNIKTLVIDKTGTLTHGKVAISAIKPAPGFSENDVLQYAAAIDQASPNVVARALVDAAKRRSLLLLAPHSTVEVPGQGIHGSVNGRAVAVGSPAFVACHTETEFQAEQPSAGVLAVAVAVDGRLVGLIFLSDPPRREAKAFVEAVRAAGIKKVILASGDYHETAAAIAHSVGISTVRGQLQPKDKVDLVLLERQNDPVMMVGDGVNDAPALAAADIGVAMGAAGAAASAEAADIVLLTDDLSHLPVAIQIAKRARRIAWESVYAGMGLSLCCMVAGAAGYITPVQGALLQEVIDVAVIVNALRVLRDGARAPLKTKPGLAPVGSPQTL
jgi:heavy metal translocating P-type ATPase